MRAGGNGAKMRLRSLWHVCINAHMATSQERIEEVEARAKQLGLSISDLCTAAEVHRATWQRWKAGKGKPDIEQWGAVESLLDQRSAA
jgi:DNA-binding transcriptional regulator YiaG